MPKYSIEENRRWQNSLPTKRVSADALFWNDKGELLIVKTNYKDYWQLPGGVVDEAESPLDAAVREVKEELGLDIPKEQFKFRVTMYTPEHEGFKDFIAFTFDCGVLSQAQINNIKLQEDELEEYKFASLEEAKKLLKPSLADRVLATQSQTVSKFLTARAT
jgi:8-oxo-dGTP diphosphatase